MTKSLLGRVIIVTGSGRGLGRAHAELLAAEGASVVVNDLAGADGNPADDAVSAITAAGGTAVADGNSVAEWDSAKRIVQTALAAFGRLDGIVTNAGFLRDKMLTSMVEADYDDIIKVHQYGTFHLLKHGADHWRGESKAGRPVAASVVTVTAAAGLHSNVGQVNYSSAKSAIAMMSISASRELGRYGVRVNSISPIARTRLTEALIGGPPDSGFDDQDPANISPLVAWLLNAECPASGQVYHVGGRFLDRYTTWQPVDMAETDAAWTIDSVRKAMSDWPSEFVPTRFSGLPAEAP